MDMLMGLGESSQPGKYLVGPMPSYGYIFSVFLFKSYGVRAQFSEAQKRSSRDRVCVQSRTFTKNDLINSTSGLQVFSQQVVLWTCKS